MTTTLSLLRFGHYVDLATFSITETNTGLGAAVLAAPRFHYSAKASKHDRAGSKHPTVKPVNLMRWLCRLVTPPGGLILDPFAGSGTTGAAAHLEGFRALLCEREAEYQTDIENRLRELCGEDASPDLFAEEPVPAATPDLFEGLGL
jgi:tRNA G10  N-methylase Trm11